MHELDHFHADFMSTICVHKAHHVDIKNQSLVIGQFKNRANQKQPALFCFFVIGWCSHIDQSQGAGFQIRGMGFVYSRGIQAIFVAKTSEN